MMSLNLILWQKIRISCEIRWISYKIHLKSLKAADWSDIPHFLLVFHKMQFHWNQKDFTESTRFPLKPTGFHEIQQDFSEISKFYEIRRILQDFMKSNRILLKQYFTVKSVRKSRVKSARFHDKIRQILWNPPNSKRNKRPLARNDNPYGFFQIGDPKN